MSNELITLTQKPIIKYDAIEKQGKLIKKELAKYNIDKIVPTEESLQDIKSLLAKFNKDFKGFEGERKDIKSILMVPYDDLEDSYNKHIKNPYMEAISTLKAMQVEVESKLLEEKIEKLKEYFEEVNSFEFVSFEDVGLRIIRSTTDAKYKKEIDAFIEKIGKDLELIQMEEHKDRIFVRYQSNLDVSDSILTVKREIEAEKQLQAEKEKVVEVPKPEAVVYQEPQPIQEVVTEPQPVDEPKVQRGRATFTVIDTVDNIRMVQNFMNEHNIRYENGAK